MKPSEARVKLLYADHRHGGTQSNAAASPVDVVSRLRGRQPGQGPGLDVHRVSADFRRVPGNDVAERLIVSRPEFIVDVKPAAAWRGAWTQLASQRVRLASAYVMSWWEHTEGVKTTV